VRQVYDVLSEKETAIKRLRREIDALRLVCQMVHEEGDSSPNACDSSVEREDDTEAVRRAHEKEAALARLRIRLLEEPQEGATESSGNVLLQFGRAALGASRSLLKRVLVTRLLEREPPGKTIRDVFERLGRSPAA